MKRNKKHGKNAKDKLEEIKYLLRVGEITYDEAKRLAIAPLRVLNGRMREISEEHGFKHRDITFQRFFR